MKLVSKAHETSFIGLRDYYRFSRIKVRDFPCLHQVRGSVLVVLMSGPT